LTTKCGRPGVFCGAQSGAICRFRLKGKTMTNAMAAFGIAVAGTSLICYALMTRAGKIERNRRPAGDNPTDGGSTSGSDGWAAVSWFGGDHSATDSSGNPSDFGGGDSGGGGGSGGGGDGGDGGDGGGGGD
jgi:hypothetical protein